MFTVFALAYRTKNCARLSYLPAVNDQCVFFRMKSNRYLIELADDQQSVRTSTVRRPLILLSSRLLS